ncbi:MAG TPA: preprotein translocase subunit SecA [Coxiellaceae bacterium]|nr:preprotein translocase subunit SecA [Coxiellaceae bacterium]
MLIVSNLLKKFFGSRNQRAVKRLSKEVAKINALESTYDQLTDDTLRAKTDEFRARLQQGTPLDDLLVEAFAAVREASKRTLKMRHFDVQLIGGMVLHHGKIAEMCTGEGKTLVATLPAYLNALTGQGVHIVTVNDYLAKRDAEWMGPIYRFLGLTVGVVVPDMNPADKKSAYAADVIYGTNNEFGFDYLRDNMAFALEDRMQRELHYAIVDEVDSILIDEARTPLIISGPSDDSSDLYQKINQLIPLLTPRKTEEGPGDYYLEEKHKQAYLTEAGHQYVEKLMQQHGLIREGESLYDPQNIILMHHLNAALRAHALYRRDVDYIVTNGEVVIVDEFTGRTMPGRRWSDGLHQAVEAKEGVPVQNENQTLATITFQNYFRLYKKLSGMTGTADTEAYEFQEIYHLEVLVIPTNKSLVRKDYPDRIYITMREKFNAIAQEIKTCVERQQPVLVGTASIENSELLSDLLQKEKIPHQVLNAKHHEKEAKIIAEAGRPGSVTIATNMAGRGTDIILGGNLEAEIAALENATPEAVELLCIAWKECHEGVIAAGGLHVIGSERHESRRVDNQLRGRSGRQGDPGSSRFYVSLEDNLMRIFAADRMSSIMRRLGLKEGEAIEHSFISRAIENAQRKVESFHFDMRKQLLEYDNVANDQRKVIYQQRSELMVLADISETVHAIRRDVINQLIDTYIPPHSLEEEWDISGLEKQLAGDFLLSLSLQDLLAKETSFDEERIRDYICAQLETAYQEKEARVGSATQRQLEKMVMLQFLDTRWKEHLAMMDHLRGSIHLSGYAQKDPKQEYKRESFILFSSMLDAIKLDVIRTLTIMQPRMSEEEALQLEAARREQAAHQQRIYQHATFAEATKEHVTDQSSIEEGEKPTQPVRREGPKVGRNDPCSCGSGKKYKQCCGKLS